MPKVIKKKTVKKKPVEEGEVKSAAFQALEKIRERQKHVIIGVSVIAAVVALFLGTSLYSTSNYKKAASLEREANNFYYGENINTAMPEKERLDKALELFTRSTDVKVTPTNLFYLGNTYFKLKDYENAINEYNRFTTKFSSEKAILPLVYQKLASSYFKTGNNEAALEILDKLAAMEGGIFKDTALLYEARYLDGAGKKEESLEKYREIFTQFPSSPWAAEANEKVSSEEAKKEGEKTSTIPDVKAEQKPASPAAQEKNQTDQPGNAQEMKKEDQTDTK
jgi:tetratricopeptide (TPR) repeat protein